MDPKTHPVISPPLSCHRVFSLCVCHASCCHLKLMNSNDFTARRRHSVLYVLHGNRWQRLPEQFLDCWSVLRIRDGGTIWKLLCCSAVMDHAAGMSVALDFVIVHQAWVRESPFSPSIKRCCCARLPRKLMGCLYDASSTMFYSEEQLFFFFSLSHSVFQQCFVKMTVTES